MKIKAFVSSLFIAGVLATSSLPVYAKTDTLIIAGGGFWSVESDFSHIPGVIEVVSGYTGGTVANPTYELVASKTTGHFEAVMVSFDDSMVSLQELVDYYWKTIDPTDAEGQFCDKGAPYRTALFYQNDTQKQVFEQSLAEVTAKKPFKEAIVTQILPALPFYQAEEYQQDYFEKNPVSYKYYRRSCGRDDRVESLWGELVSDH